MTKQVIMHQVSGIGMMQYITKMMKTKYLVIMMTMMVMMKKTMYLDHVLMLKNGLGKGFKKRKNYQNEFWVSGWVLNLETFPL